MNRRRPLSCGRINKRGDVGRTGGKEKYQRLHSLRMKISRLGDMSSPADLTLGAGSQIMSYTRDRTQLCMMWAIRPILRHLVIESTHLMRAHYGLDHPPTRLRSGKFVLLMPLGPDQA